MFGAMQSRMIRLQFRLPIELPRMPPKPTRDRPPIQAAEKGRRPKRLSQRGRLTVLSPIRVSRAWSLCRAPGQELQLELVARPETVPVETLRLFQTIAEPILGHLALSRRELGEGP